MIFRHQVLSGQLEWTPTAHLCEFVVESPALMRRVLRDLTVDNSERELSFTENGEAVSFAKNIDVIFNPTKLDFNNRRAMTTLLKLLVKTSLSEDFYLTTNKVKTKILRYLDKIVDAESFEFEVATEDFMIDSLAKAVNVHIIGDEDDFVELITDYLAMMAELVAVRLFVFVNLRAVLDNEELGRLHHNLNNHQIDVLLVESQARKKLTNVPRLLVDADQCEF